MKRLTITPATFMSAAEVNSALDFLERTDLPYNAYLARLNSLDSFVRANGTFATSDARALRRRLDHLYEETWSRHPLREAAFEAFTTTARTAKFCAGDKRRWPKSLQALLASKLEGCPDDDIPVWLTACLAYFACSTAGDIAATTGHRVTPIFFFRSA
jgi:hypothetical protein